MGRKSKLKLPPLDLGQETFGQRLAQLRKEKGFTQVELAKKTGLTQGLISDYELDKLRPYHEVIARFALALEITTDELLGLKQSKGENQKANLKLIRRLQKIETLPPTQQRILFKTIDTFIEAAEKRN